MPRKSAVPSNVEIPEKPDVPPGAETWSWPHHEEHLALLVYGLKVVNTVHLSDNIVVHSYILKARIFGMEVHLFHPVERVLHAGLNLPIEGDSRPYTDSERAAYKDMMALIPNFERTLRGLLRIQPALFVIFHQRKAMDNGIQGHTRAVLEASVGGRLLLEDPLVDEFEPRLLDVSNKSTRGFHNITTGRLICPHKHVDFYDRDREGFLRDVANGTIKIKASLPPSFLFPFGQRYDAKHLDKNMFDNPLLVRIANLLYVGKSTMFGGPPASNNESTAHKHRITAVSARSLCYFVLHLRHTASSATALLRTNGTFRNDTFYETCRKLLPDGAKFTKAVLAKVNSEVVDLKNAPKGKAAATPEEDADDEDFLEQVNRQREDRENGGPPSSQPRDEDLQPPPQPAPQQPPSRSPRRSQQTSKGTAPTKPTAPAPRRRGVKALPPVPSSPTPSGFEDLEDEDEHNISKLFSTPAKSDVTAPTSDKDTDDIYDNPPSSPVEPSPSPDLEDLRGSGGEDGDDNDNDKDEEEDTNTAPVLVHGVHLEDYDYACQVVRGGMNFADVNKFEKAVGCMEEAMHLIVDKKCNTYRKLEENYEIWSKNALQQKRTRADKKAAAAAAAASQRPDPFALASSKRAGTPSQDSQHKRSKNSSTSASQSQRDAADMPPPASIPRKRKVPLALPSRNQPSRACTARTLSISSQAAR